MTLVTFEPGDIFACFGSDRVSRFISIQTALPWSPRRLRLGPSHVAIASCISTGDAPAGLLWVESTTMTARQCLAQRRRVAGCQCHAIHDRACDYLGAGGAVDLYRLTPINGLSEAGAAELCRDLSHFIAERVGYDAASAIFSGTKLLRAVDKALSLWPGSPESVFCSQLLAAELQASGLMNRDNPQRYHPGRLLRQLVRQGVYRRIGTLQCAEYSSALSLQG